MAGSATDHEIEFYGRYIGPSQDVVVDGSVHLSAALSPGRYVLRCKATACYLRQGGAGLTVDDNQAPLAADTPIEITVDDQTNKWVAVKTATGLGGTLRISRTDVVLPGPRPGSLALHRTLFQKRYIGSTTILTLGGATATAGPLVAGRYRIVCKTCDGYLRQGAVGVTASSSEMRLPANEIYEFNVDDSATAYVAGMSASLPTTGQARITRIDEVT